MGARGNKRGMDTGKIYRPYKKILLSLFCWFSGAKKAKHGKHRESDSNSQERKFGSLLLQILQVCSALNFCSSCLKKRLASVGDF